MTKMMDIGDEMDEFKLEISWQVLQRIHAIKTLQYPLRTQVTGQIAKVTADIFYDHNI